MRAIQMTGASLACAVLLASVGFLAGGCFDLTQGGDSAEAGAATASSGDGDGDGGAAAATPVGGACGIEENSGSELCRAVSTCPNVVVDNQAMPHCGFRIRGAAVDLVCGCSNSLCPVGVFTTCTEAAKLLANQTEQGVCIQLAEGRCVESRPQPTTTTTGNPACDRQCVTDCGGGAACASICNCD